MTQYTVEELERVGGREWRKSDSLHRVYFDITPEMIGITVEYYNTGNIQRATRDGEVVSNNTARGYLNDLRHRMWYDVVTGQFMSQGFENEWIVKRAKRYIESAIEATRQAA